MLRTHIPKQGSLLLSEPFMMDPNFQRSVILLCEHHEEGSLGLVLNQPSALLLKDVMQDMPDAEYQLFIGGPVGQDSIQFVHQCYDRLNSGIAIGENLFWGGNFEALKLLIQDHAIGMDEIKFFIGYSGWEKGQLANELAQNAWITGDQYNPDLIFMNDGENLWKQAVISLGPRYAHVANFPVNPTWN